MAKNYWRLCGVNNANSIIRSAEEAPDPDYVVLPMEAGDIVPFDGVLLSLDAAKVLNEKRFSDVECEVQKNGEPKIQEQNYQLRLDKGY